LWGIVVPIGPLLLNSRFTPEEVTVLLGVFEEAIQDLGLVDRTDPAVALVAKRVIELARKGERNPAFLRYAVLKSFRDNPGVSDL
jgi:hypothetical protein